MDTERALDQEGVPDLETVVHLGDLDPEAVVDEVRADPDDAVGAEVYLDDPELGRSAEEAALHVEDR